ncbi:HD domain-containing protein [Nocardioides sp. GCM10030258]|uniref:HD domain-containing protein n=1 Tax=unclassified Nocardioides TaxID=2615069 RepID=UPI00362004F5
MASREVRDPIHGLINLDPHEWKVVDSPAFQRLRGIQQLAFTHLVYPGARHSRFEHCIGAAHIAGHVATVLDEDAKRLRAAGLCHDLGHGAFSHVSEMVYEELTGREHIHEAISAAIVLHHDPVAKALGKDLSHWIADLLSGKGHGEKRSFERDVIAGPADIDKLDYLLRDSHFCGVNYGRFDMYKVVESMRKVTDIQGSYLGFDAEGIYAVEELLLARYHMHRQVYGHRTRVATDKMLIRAMLFGVEEGLLPRVVFEPPEVPDDAYVAEYLLWDDQRVIRTLLDAPDGSRARAMMSGLTTRHLLKETCRLSHAELEQDLGLNLAGNAVKPQKKAMSVVPEAEKVVAEAAGVDPEWVVFHWESLKSPIGGASRLRLPDSQVPILVDGNFRPLNDVSDIFTTTEQVPKITVVAYIQPPDKPFSQVKVKKIRKAFKESMMLIAEASARL